MTIDECRRFYSEEVRFTANIHSAALVEAFARVPREKFLGPGPWEIASAELRGFSALGAMQMSYTPVDDPRQLYHNVVVVLDKAGDINNGQPSALARWIDALDLKAGLRAYHLGSGVGYYTAIMAEIVGPDGSIVAAEVNSDLAARAKHNLSSYPNVTVVAGDGATFDPGECDAILVNAGVTHPRPQWLDRLREGGRLVVPLTMKTTPTLGIGVMTKIVRRGSKFSAEIVTSLAIYSCTSARDAQLEPLLKAAMTSGALMKMKSVRRDPHAPSDTCLMHAADVCLSSADIG
ncbi:MAG: rRNA adenine N-6-methyltransferase family protein [Candidatus Sulfotelmatobacter sp.]